MIVHDVQQGTEEWHQIRLARPTASRFKDILTQPRSKADREAGVMSQTAETYLAECFSEWAIGEPTDGATSPWMERGQRQEGEALDAYPLFTDIGGAEVKRVGFVTLDDDLLSPGCSPDALVGDDGGVEIKIHGAAKHAAFMFKPDRFLKEHYAQVQGGLWITGRAWWDLVAYNPKMVPVVHRVERDETFILNLEARVAEFTAMLEDRLAEFGYQPQIVSAVPEGAETLDEPEVPADVVPASPTPPDRPIGQASELYGVVRAAFGRLPIHWQAKIRDDFGMASIATVATMNHIAAEQVLDEIKAKLAKAAPISFQDY